MYVRQSSAHQVRGNRESGERQYALIERAKALGWPGKSVETIDEDQGRSGTSSAHRQGFKKLLAEIGAGQVGVVLALEASRLARSSADWHRLVEICVVTQTLLADETAVYDPRDPNDRLLLGVKGTISEAELFTLRTRLHAGRWNKARRGELVRSLPVGYVRIETGAVLKHPDRQVQARLNYVFRLFAQRKVARQVVVELVRKKLRIPAIIWGGPRHGDVTWKDPDFSDVMRILHNPTYAGAYVYGKSEYDELQPFANQRKSQNSSAQTGRLAGVPAGRVPSLHHVGGVRAESGNVACKLVPSWKSWRAHAKGGRLLAGNCVLREVRGTDECAALFHQAKRGLRVMAVPTITIATGVRLASA